MLSMTGYSSLCRLTNVDKVFDNCTTNRTTTAFLQQCGGKAFLIPCRRNTRRTTNMRCFTATGQLIYAYNTGHVIMSFELLQNNGRLEHTFFSVSVRKFRSKMPKFPS
uniref:Uncharacterized protein n=1 Tax=Trichobilharzia regenti TaxID=157069 RepID=A0AA85IS58_TRIRE|nr:unnamed protein product [Trichobilharzia regenti]